MNRLYNNMRFSLPYLIVVYLYLFTTCSAIAGLPLKIITSDNLQSNEVHSFIYVPLNKTIPQGIKQQSKSPPLKLQIPFVIDLPVTLKNDENIRWTILSRKQNNGNIQVLSQYDFIKSRKKNLTSWDSAWLNQDIEDRQRLVFRPQPHLHKPPIYKKGRGPKGKRRRYGGGTLKIDHGYYNPQISFYVEAHVTSVKTGETKIYSGDIAMDHKDMIRQEYINHYGINRYGRGGNGNLPVPLRNEITETPENSMYLLGNLLSESKYGLMIDDGIASLTSLIVNLYENAKQEFKSENKQFVDLNGKPLVIPESELWLSGGWRNPERNEWYSNALNGIHQRGGAVDLIANEPHSDTRAAIVYWFLWQVLETQNNINAFWQLETHGRPMTTREFNEDIEPVNGIPDAFDKADHIHINIKYEPYE